MEKTFQVYVVCLFCLNASLAKPESRVIGGQSAAAGQFRFAAAIYVQTSDSRFFCGGSLVGTSWVVTAGHCVNNATLFTIQLGSNYLTGNDANRVSLASSEYIVHPDFNPETIENDIGLIKLRIPVTWNDHIYTVYVPTVELLNQTEVILIGWGQTSDFSSDLSEELQYVSVSVLSNPECKLTYGDQITDNMVCVEGNYNEGACTGDNGGALIEYVNRTPTLVGIGSFVSGNGCESTDPSGFTRIYPYAQWIFNVTST